MGGPWRDRGFDPRAWRAPAPHGVREDRVLEAGDRGELRIVLGTTAAVVASLAGMLLGLTQGWW
jgi:hypothetical protein